MTGHHHAARIASTKYCVYEVFGLLVLFLDVRPPDLLCSEVVWY